MCPVAQATLRLIVTIECNSPPGVVTIYQEIASESYFWGRRSRSGSLMIGRKTKPTLEEQEKLKGFDDFDLRLGDVMRGERATLGKSLLDVQRELKIKAPYIAAIENSDPTAFETPGFIAGYVRSYARYLELDPEWAFGTFCAESGFATAHGMSSEASVTSLRSDRGARSAESSGPADPFLNPNTPFVPTGPVARLQIQPGAIGSMLVLLALIGAIGYGGWSVLQEVQRVRLAPINQTPGVVADVGDLGLPAAVSQAPDQVAGLRTPPPEALDRLYRPEALAVPVLVARDGPIAALDPARTGALVDGVGGDNARLAMASTASPQPPVTLASDKIAADAAPAPAADPATPQVVAADAPEVVLVAMLPTWVRVRAADRTVIFERILNRGERYALPKTQEPASLRAGNAGALYFAVSGQTYGPAGNGPVVVKNIALAADNLRNSYAVADLSKAPDDARILAEAEAVSLGQPPLQ